MAPKPALLWCVRIVLILHACFLVIRLGLASHIVRILTKCQADRSKCDDVNDETNAASLSLAWAVVVAATAGIAAAATVIGNGWLWNLQKDLWGVKACVPVVLVAWCLDAICLGLSVKEFQHDGGNQHLPSSSLGGALGILTFVQVVFSTLLLLLLVPLQQSIFASPRYVSSSSPTSSFLYLCLNSLNLVFFICRVALAGSISNDAHNCIALTSSLSSKHCTVVAANTNDATPLLVTQTLWAGMVGLAVCTLAMFVPVTQGRKVEQSKAVRAESVAGIALISFALDLVSMGCAVKQFSMDYPDTNDNHFPRSSATSLLGFLSVFQPLIIHFPLLVILLRLSPSSKSIVPNLTVAALGLSVILHICRIGVASKLVDDILECRANAFHSDGGRSKCGDMLDDINAATPRLAEVSLLSGVVGVVVGLGVVRVLNLRVWQGPVWLSTLISLLWVLLSAGVGIQQIDLHSPRLKVGSLGQALAALCIVQAGVDSATLTAIHKAPRDSGKDESGSLEMQ